MSDYNLGHGAAVPFTPEQEERIREIVREAFPISQSHAINSDALSKAIDRINRFGASPK